MAMEHVWRAWAGGIGLEGGGWSRRALFEAD